MEPDLLDRLAALPPAPATATAPRLRLVRLHADRLKSIRRLDLPEDGIAWDGQMPDLMVVGGVNGSGKTTLLDFIELGVRAHSESALLWRHDLGRTGPPGAHSWIEFEMACRALPPGRSRFDWEPPVHPSSDPALRVEVNAVSGRGRTATTHDRDWHDRWVKEVASFEHSDLPGLVYLPSEGRMLMRMPVGGAIAERLLLSTELPRPRQFVSRWKIDLETPLEAQLFAARWADLNARDRGEKPRHFVAFDEAFRVFFGDEKRLAWTADGQLYVEVLAHDGSPDGYRPIGQHGVAELSAGEKQVLILASQLLILWKPGSLVLIDEPELHLHTHWQTRLWELLVHFQRTRGGQVVIATQSPHLFGLAPPGSAVLLGREAL